MAISVGSVEVDVIPNTRGIYAQLRAALVPAATRAGDDAGSAAGRAFGPAMQRQVGDIGLRIGEQIGRQMANRITASLRDAVRDGVTRGGQASRPAAVRQGEETGGAFARSMKAKLEAAFKSLPKANVSLDDTGVDADLARLRARMETLSGKRIGVDVDVAAAQAEITDIEERLRRLGAAHPNVSVRADTAAARAQLAAMREEIARLTADPHRIRLETDGSFGARLRAAVQAAEAALPNVNIGADTTPAEAEIASLRAQLTALRDQRVGIDIDAETARAKISDVQARLQRLSASDADVNLRVDSAAAVAQLAQVQAMVSALDGQTARIDVDTSGAASAIFQLTVAVAGVAAIPAIPILAAGLGAVASAAVAAAVGVGAIAAVAIPAFTSIAGALLAQKQAQDAATNATLKGGQAAGQGASKALQLAGAQQSLATAHRNAARQIGQAQQGVQDAVRQAAEASRNAAQQMRQAEKGVADAVQQAAEQQRQAVQQVREARQGLADAVQQAADRQQAADDGVVQAERSLADAQAASRQAQLDLTQARRDAAMELEDLSNRLADAQLSERGAALAVVKARQRLDAVRAAGDRASLLTQQEAQLQYDEAVQRLREQQIATKRTAAEKKAADKAGVEGSDKVKTAQERVAQAQQAVRDQTANLARAQRDAARQQQENARNIATAQGRVAEAQRNVARVQRQGADAVAAAQDKLAEAQRNVTKVQADGARSVARAQEQLASARQSAADSIASAERQIASASTASAGGVDQAAIAQAKYQEKLAKLTPAARATFDAFVDLRGAFSKWSKALQPAVMPIFTRALVGLKNSLPGLTPIVKGAADGIKDLQDKASAGFKKPWWEGFKKNLATNIRPAIVGMGVAFGNVFKGMVGIVDAFLAHTDGINRHMERITGRFANWGTSLKGSPGFERFLSYASEKGPQVARAIGDISSAFYQIARALEPLSGPVLEVIGGLARGIASIAETLPWLIQLMYLAWIATRLWTLALLVFNAVVDANPITLIILAIIGLVAAVVYAYKHWGWFRDIVNAAWSGIKTATMAAWAFLQPIFAAIWSVLQWVGDKAVWLWRNVIQPVFSAIALAAGILITAILTILITPLVLAFKLVATVARWLWANAIKPTFNAIAGAASWLWKNAISPAFHGIASVARWLYNNVIKPVGALIKGSFRIVGDTGRWLWQKALRPAFHGIADVARWLSDKVIKPVFKGISTAIGVAWRIGIRPVFNAIKSAIGKVADAFGAAKDAIKEAWSAIKDATKKPINWVLKHVWNEGIVAIWKKITGWIPGVPQLGKVDYLASGGQLRGPQPGVYSQPTAIVGEGNPRWPEFVIPTDPKYRPRALGLLQAAGTQMLAKGGVIGSVTSFLKNPIKSFGNMLQPFMDGAKWLSETKWGKAAIGLPKMVISKLKKIIKDNISGLFTRDASGLLKFAGVGSGVKRWTPQVLQALSELHQPASYLGITLRRMNQESGGNPLIVNKWDCLTLDAMILTQRGWLKHDEVREGDLTIGYNPDAEQSEWTRITRVVHFSDAPLIKLGNSRWSATTTPNHRWVNQPSRYKKQEQPEGDSCSYCAWPEGTRRRGKSTTGGLRIHLAKAHGVKAKPQKEIASKAEWVTTEGIRAQDRLLLSAPAATESSLGITVQEAALLGWVAGDGYIEKACPTPDECSRNGFTETGVCKAHRARQNPTISVAQSKPDMVEKLRVLLADIPHSVYTDDRPTRLGNNGVGPRYVFRIGYQFAQHLLHRTGHPRDNAVEQVLAMSPEQREAWLEAITDAEGHRSQASSGNKPQVVIYQRPGTVLDAIALAVYLSGSRPRIAHQKRQGQPDWSPEALVRVNNSVVTGHSLKKEDAGRGEVWCVTTELGSWTARQDDHIFLTGNSNWKAGHPSVGLMQVIGPTFRSNAGKYKKKGPFLYGTSVDPLANIYASMRYALRAYGSLPRAYNRAGGYDSGGYLQPGLNLAYNGTGRPEPVFTTQQANALMRLGTDPTAGLGDLHVQVYVGDREITDIARAEVRRNNGELVSTLRANRRG